MTAVYSVYALSKRANCKRGTGREGGGCQVKKTRKKKEMSVSVSLVTERTNPLMIRKSFSSIGTRRCHHSFFPLMPNENVAGWTRRQRCGPEPQGSKETTVRLGYAGRSIRDPGCDNPWLSKRWKTFCSTNPLALQQFLATLWRAYDCHTEKDTHWSKALFSFQKNFKIFHHIKFYGTYMEY